MSPPKISGWEIAGIPAALAFDAAHSLGFFSQWGIEDSDIPHLMVLVYIICALSRSCIFFVRGDHNGD